jgi:DNA-binding transcriptional regulator YiaG
MDEQENFGDALIGSLRDALAFRRGEMSARTKTARRVGRGTRVDTPPDYDAQRIVAVRRKMALSQAGFALALHVSVPTVRAWEQGARKPEGAAQRLLEIAETHPDLLASKVHG